MRSAIPLSIMLQNLDLSSRRTHALTALILMMFTLGAFSLFVSINDSYASESIPLPEKKPNFRQPLNGETRIKGSVVQYSLKDFAKALLDHGQPPVPEKKPTMTADNSKISGDASDEYREIFAMQAKGDMDAAQAKMARLSDKRLRGHVLYQRYMHPTAYKSSFEELHDWLARYSDHPGADKIYKLAQKKKPASYSGALKKPKKKYGIARRTEPLMVPARTYNTSKSRSAAEEKSVAALQKSVKKLLRESRPTQALETFENADAKPFMDQVERDILTAKIAREYMHVGQMDKAFNIAASAAKRSGLHVPTAGWVAGLSAWSKGDYKTAAKYFEIPARSPYASGWTAAGGAYWAARSYTKAGSVKNVSTWLERAAAHPRTFYGLIATRALGRDFDFNWDYPAFTKKHHALLRDNEIGARALALVAAGQTHLAEAELLRLKPDSPEMTAALLSYAGYAGLPALSLRLGGAYETSDGLYFDAALYPKGQWKKERDYKISSALLHAIMRQESRFDPLAESYSGARGLMQLMPATARHVAGKALDPERLDDPVYNLELGEKYLTELMHSRRVDRDLISLLIAYNAGPGNLASWKKDWASVDDSLLFIELIPSRESQTYVERVLSNYWIYRMREGGKTPTLNALAQGKKAKYALVESSSSEFKIAQSR